MCGTTRDRFSLRACANPSARLTILVHLHDSVLTGFNQRTPIILFRNSFIGITLISPPILF